jgi:Tol biopolymer transport system component
VEDDFVRDRAAGVTRRVSIGRRGRQANDHVVAPSISADGRFVAFSSWASTLVPGDSNGTYDVFVRDRRSGVTQRVSVCPAGVQANGHSNGAAISADGRHIAFASDATNLVAGDTNNEPDMFVRHQAAAG